MKKIFQTLSVAAVLCACLVTYSSCQAAEAVNYERQGFCWQAEDDRAYGGCPGYRDGENCRGDNEGRYRGEGRGRRHGGCHW